MALPPFLSCSEGLLGLPGAHEYRCGDRVFFLETAESIRPSLQLRTRIGF